MPIILAKAGPSKVQKAKGYGIKTISADKFLQMIKKGE
jgi:BRCT domain type II-containing protein